MNHDNTSHRVFKIGELTRLVASQLVSISQRSAVNLACACRCLEEPVLSTLWETQPLLYTLLMTLPEDTWGQWGNVEYNRIEVWPGPCDGGVKTLKFRDALVQAHGGSTTGGLEQSPTLRVLDARSPCP